MQALRPWSGATAPASGGKSPRRGARSLAPKPFSIKARIKSGQLVLGIALGAEARAPLAADRASPMKILRMMQTRLASRPAACGPRPSGHFHPGCSLRKVGAESALVEFGHGGAFELVALVQECEPEGLADIAENLSIFGPGDDRAGAHDG
jgi:hypothetical protein